MAKGEVTVFVQDGMLRVNFCVAGQRRRWALGIPDTPLGRKVANGVAQRIHFDILGNHYLDDPNHYRPSFQVQIDSTSDLSQHRENTLELWENFLESRLNQGTSDATITAKYLPLRNHLVKFNQSINNIDSASSLINILRSKQSNHTANLNLWLVKKFGTWAVKQGYWPENYFGSIRPLKVERTPRQDKPFTAEEVKLFLSTIKTDTNYFSYHDFCYCLFHLGCRPSELIGLRWGHVDLVRHSVTICESLSRGDDGKTAGYARKRKSTKTGGYRILPLSGELVAIFKGRHQGQGEDDLVFTAPKGGAIDDHNFSQRCWRSICTKAGIPYRPPYIARHTCLSHNVVKRHAGYRRADREFGAGGGGGRAGC